MLSTRVLDLGFIVFSLIIFHSVVLHFLSCYEIKSVVLILILNLFSCASRMCSPFVLITLVLLCIRLVLREITNKKMYLVIIGV